MNKCSIQNCENSVKYKNLCGKHYKRQWRHGDPNKTLIDMNGGICSVEDCGLSRHSSITGLCKVHDQQFKRYGRTNRIKAVNGAGTINKGGYRVITINGRKVYEHIHLAEKALGKPLPKRAVVHHMNNNPADNFTPLNLIICPDQAYHLLLHRRMKELSKKESLS